MAEKKNGKDFDIRRAYEAWVAAGEPVEDHKKNEGGKKAADKQKKNEEEGKNLQRRSSGKAERKPVAEASFGKKKASAYYKKEGRFSSREEKDQKDSPEAPASKEEKNGFAGKRFSKDETRDRTPHLPKEAPAQMEKKPAICPYHKRCGGCAYIEKDYAWTLGFKEMKVGGLLRPFVKLDGIVGMENPYHYRNKVHAVFAHVRDGNRERNVCGIYEAGTHKVVPVKNCKIENEKAGEIIQTILGMLRDFKIKVYDEDMDYGLMRHVLVRVGHATGEIMVVLVLSSPILPNKNAFVKKLLEKHPEITTIVLNVNDQKTSMVLGSRETVLHGKGYIEDVLLGNRYRISSRSFYQVNSVQTAKLYKEAIRMANLTGRERVLDAYCGIGTIGITAAARAREVIGVELNGEAVRDAIRNAKTNEIRNITFFENDAGDFLRQMAEDREMVDVIFMDPPRTGSTERFMDAAAALRPGRIIYISCGPDTLARDLAYLKKLGYRAREAKAFDMFPFTEHCEVVVSLTKSSK